MSDGQEQQNQLPVTIEGKPASMAGLLLSFGQIWLVGCVSMIVFGGIFYAILVILFFIAIGMFFVFLFRCQVYCVADLTESGVALRPQSHGRFSRRPFEFKWDEVRKIGVFGVFKVGVQGLRVTLDRPQMFWVLRPQSKNWIRIPKDIAEDPRFIDMALKRIPPENIVGDALSGKQRSASATRIRLGVVVLMSSLALVWCAISLIQGGRNLGILIIQIAAFAVTAAASACLMLDPYGMNAISGLITGTIFASVAGFMTAQIWALTTGRLDILVVLMGAMAGLTMAAALDCQ